ncbi:MAG: bifunctional phosphoribosylaminoimidazolecarboxamide formyltransferase/IMP cyclohydrolase, partial [Pseudomonadota bacterium]
MSAVDESRLQISRALVSVSDKTGVAEFAAALSERGVELLSTGGTAKALRDAGLEVRDVADVTGFPEMMGGRVKTLHPKIHGGILADRDNADHREALSENDIPVIDLLVVNLYPFEKTLARGADYRECVENIDIGGPAMVRAAAKNHAHIAVVTDTEDYEVLLEELSAGGVTLKTRQYLAQKAFSLTAAYDAMISAWLAEETAQDFPDRVALSGARQSVLRYGENPHQAAAVYRSNETRPGVVSAEIVQGKALSYNNLNDTDAAFELVSDLDRDKPAVAIIKHANPCGVAYGETLEEAYSLAHRCDPVSAFGGVIALNGEIDGETAACITSIFTEVVIAPSANAEAIEIFRKKKNLRLLLTGALPPQSAKRMLMRPIAGGFLVQTNDDFRVDENALSVVTKRQPSDREVRDLLFAFQVAKHVKSNAIVYAKDGATVGVGAGQMSRVDASRIAAQKSADAAETAGLPEPMVKGSVVASDAFFPFADGLLAAANAGATAVIQPGGSVRDEEVIAAANEADLA